MSDGQNIDMMTHLKDYRPPSHSIEKVEMKVEFFERETIVTTTLQIEQKSPGPLVPLTLDGVGLTLLSLHLNGRECPASRYQVTSKTLTLYDLPREFNLQTRVRIHPENNKSLEGLYRSGPVFCTQCEAQGFRHITYFLDRPDVMSRYRVRIEGDKTRYPRFLSNGNPIERGNLSGGRHFVVWEDPFPKPCYLFALVAGNLGVIRDRYVSILSGRVINLEIYCDPGNEARCLHAMESLKKSMKWDEETFGLEYDLDIYMIVAVDAFNMGAMENKGLNIFNSSCVLADPESATDHRYQNIEGIIAHEYFHNWTGNRVTCRDWFQLTLKEGLTVYRDQEFSADMQSRPVERVKTVKDLKRLQYSEDAGPMAHPIRPQSYLKVDNFYTATVYNKGAEVIRMVAGLIGKENFRRGMDKYFELYDGQAVTTNDFIHAMELAGGYDLDQFQKTWYEQAGTPKVWARIQPKDKGIELQIRQSTPTQSQNRPFTFPFPVAFYDLDGKLLKKKELVISREEESFSFPGIPKEAVPSLNLNFASPVNVSYDYSDQDLVFLMKFDSDDFNRFEASQKLAMREILKIKDQIKEGTPPLVGKLYFEAYAHLLKDQNLDKALKAYALRLPSFEEVTQEQLPIDFEESAKALETLYGLLDERFHHRFVELYHKLEDDGPYNPSPEAIGRRLLRNTALFVMAQGKDEQTVDLMASQYDKSNNMTDKMAALEALTLWDHPERERVSADFYRRWKTDAVVYPQWLRIQASGRFPGRLDKLGPLMKDDCFHITIPNQVSALMMGLASNPLLFHRKDGSGYRFFVDFAKNYDGINPQICARLTATLFRQYPAMDEERKGTLKDILESFRRSALSPNTLEILDKTLSAVV
ncbi:MAG: aminopeptidase N [Bacteriovoracales bacterium]|nr:aminopeptidase N [Bacteriovoracales bacterium]